MCVAVECPTWSLQGRRQHQAPDSNRRNDQHAQLAAAGSRGDDRDSSHQRDGKGDVAGGRSAGIAWGVTEQQREETTEQDGPSHEISKSRFREQKDRSGAQVGRDKECADQIPRAIDGLAPPERPAPEFGARGDPVPDESDPPHKLEALAPLPPLVQDHGREGEAKDG